MLFSRKKFLRFLGLEIEPNKMIQFGLQLDLTNSCNLNCTHCYQEKTKYSEIEQSLSIEQWAKIINDFVQMSRKLYRKPFIILCGGEPLLFKDFFLILNKIEEILPSGEVLILSNGTLITEQFLKKIETFNLKIGFQISVDGPNAESHDSVRGSGAFSKAANGLRLLKEHKIKVHIQAILSSRTSPLLEEFFILGQKMDVYQVNFTRFALVGHARNSSLEQPLTGLALKDAYEKIIHFSKQYKINTKTNRPLFHLIDPTLGATNLQGSDAMVIDPCGYVLLSSRSRIRIGHAIQDGLENIFLKNTNLIRLREGKIQGCSKCADFNYCGGDRNAAFATFGDYFAPDPGCWKNNSL